MKGRRKLLELREDYRPLLRRIKKLFPTVLAHIKTDRIALAGMTCKRSSFIARIHGNREPWSLLCKDYDYLIMFWSTRFDEKPKSYKLFVMLHELAHIPNEGFIKHHPSWRRCVKHDIEDFQFLREAYGLKLEKVKDVFKGETHLLSEGAKVKHSPRKEKIG